MAVVSPTAATATMGDLDGGRTSLGRPHAWEKVPH